VKGIIIILSELSDSIVDLLSPPPWEAANCMSGCGLGFTTSIKATIAAIPDTKPVKISLRCWLRRSSKRLDKLVRPRIFFAPTALLDDSPVAVFSDFTVRSFIWVGILGVITFYGRFGFLPLLPGLAGLGLGDASGVGETIGSEGEGEGLEVSCGAVNKKMLAVPLGTLEITFTDALDFSC
jgi:hypothetical protein